MFLCKECLEQSGYSSSEFRLRSFGKCEDCGKSKLCDDVRPWEKPAQKKEK